MGFRSVFMIIMCVCCSSAEAQNIFNEKFDNPVLSGWKIVDDGEKNKGPSQWKIEDGHCVQKSNIFTTDDGPDWNGTYLCNGSNTWSNYEFSVKMMSEDNDRIGIMFYHQDKDNYYRFRWQNEKVASKHRMNLEKVVNGQWSVLASRDIAYIQNRWYRLSITAYHGEIKATIDGKDFLYARDNSLSRGSIALYSSANKGSWFDDIAVKPAATLSYKPVITVLAGPFLQNIAPGQVTVVWETDSACNGEVRYGKSEQYDLIEKSNIESKIHVIQLKNLEPETEYHYEVSAGNNGSLISGGDSRFTTAVYPGTPVSFGVYSDSQYSAVTHEKIARLLYEKKPAFVLHAGDISSTGMDKNNLLQQFFIPARDLLRHVPFYLAKGNHEYFGKKNDENGKGLLIDQYLAYPGKDFYSFDFGNCHVVALNTNVTIKPGSEQYTWLEQDLKNSGKPWKFVFFHHPIYFIGKQKDYSPDKYAFLPPIFEKYNVSIVFNGHFHHYVRSHPLHNNDVSNNGVYYVISGGGGGSLTDRDEDLPAWVAKTEKTHNFIMVYINKNRLTFKAFDGEGNIIDAFVVNR